MQAAGFKARDLARFGQPITHRVRDHIIGLARQNGLEIEEVKRYSQWLASLKEHTAGQRDTQRLGQPAQDKGGRSYRGFNPFLEEDEKVLPTSLRGEPALAGWPARRLRSLLLDWSRGRISRLLRRFRLHGLLRKIGRSHTYHLTPLARRVITAVLDIKNNLMVPRLAAAGAEN